MKKCSHCQSQKIKKNGKTPKSIQKYYCNYCKKNFLETHGTVYFGRQLSYDLIDKLVHLNCEGVRIRAISRLEKVSRNTVSDILEVAGVRPKAVNDEIMKDLPCKEIQFDEMWGFIKKT